MARPLSRRMANAQDGKQYLHADGHMACEPRVSGSSGTLGHPIARRRRRRVLLPRTPGQRRYTFRARGQGLLSPGWGGQPKLYRILKQKARSPMAVHEPAHPVFALTSRRSARPSCVRDLYSELDVFLLPRKARHLSRGGGSGQKSWRKTGNSASLMEILVDRFSVW